MRPYLINLPAAPDVGAKIDVYNHRGKRHRLTLTRVDDPWRPADIVLHWIDEAGIRYTSGLRSRSLYRVLP